MPKKPLGINVYEAAKQRIREAFDDFPRIYCSFSGGKDSSVMLHLLMDEAKKRNRKIGVLFVDLEGQYKATIKHIEDMFELYSEYIEPYWVSLPLSLRNAVSQYQPKWTCWERSADWIRQPPKKAITDYSYFPFFEYGMEFEEFVPEFGKWYGEGKLTACFVGIRSDESLNRYRTVVGKKAMFEGRKYTTRVVNGLYNIYPIYDWKVSDIWVYNSRFNKSYNKLYDLMHQAELTPSQMRICQPYGDDQCKGLYLFHVIEPETWGKVVARVNGANQGALYAQESGNILGNRVIKKPDGHTWESYAKLLLESLPPGTKEHYENKIAIFLRWWAERGYEFGIPYEMPIEYENASGKERKPSWRRICKALLRNDYWCKGLSFSQTKSASYDKYKKVMRKRRAARGQLFNI